MLRSLSLVGEQNRSELDLDFTLGVDRYHEVLDPQQRAFTDATDLSGMVGLRYLLPITRPERAYQVRLLRLAHDRLDQERTRLARELRRRAEQADALRREQSRALALLDEQAKIVSLQLKEAYREFRSGKLQFQNFLDHWERYQSARLQYWATQRLIWLAAADIIPLLASAPSFCR